MRLLFIILFCSSVPVTNFAQNTDKTPADVFQLVKNSSLELQLVAKKMNGEIAEPIPFGIKNASPREVYFQAVGLVTKLNVLTFEKNRSTLEVPEIIAKNVTPTDVYKVMEIAMSQIKVMKKEYGITENPSSFQLDLSKTPTDVLKAIIQINVQVSVLLETKVSPSHVYRRVTESLLIASDIYMKFNNTRTIKKPLRTSVQYTPKDVYENLLECLVIEKAIFDDLKLKMATVTEKSRLSIAPSDVYDLAGLCQAEMKFLEDNIGERPSTIPSVGQSNKTPTDVYYRVEHTKQYLNAILNLLSEQPNVLAKKS